jgi:hypothetical protein
MGYTPAWFNHLAVGQHSMSVQNAVCSAQKKRVMGSSLRWSRPLHMVHMFDKWTTECQWVSFTLTSLPESLLPLMCALQNDGNLVLHNVGTGALVWQTGVTYPNPGFCNVQADSNFVCIGANGANYWASGTKRKGNGKSTRMNNTLCALVRMEQSTGHQVRIWYVFFRCCFSIQFGCRLSP